MEKYGKTGAEAEAQEMLRCRQIVSEIMNFGVSQRETLRIMHLLSLELEDRELLLSLSESIKRGMSGSAAPLSGLIVET
jgi:hypothetical protein